MLHVTSCSAAPCLCTYLLGIIREELTRNISLNGLSLKHNRCWSLRPVRCLTGPPRATPFPKSWLSYYSAVTLRTSLTVSSDGMHQSTRIGFIARGPCSTLLWPWAELPMPRAMLGLLWLVTSCCLPTRALTASTAQTVIALEEDLVAAVINNSVLVAELSVNLRLNAKRWPMKPIVRNSNFTIIGASFYPILDLAFIETKITLEPGVMFTFQRMEVRNTRMRSGFEVDLFSASPNATVRFAEAIYYCFSCLPVQTIYNAMLRGPAASLPAVITPGASWCRAQPQLAACFNGTVLDIRSASMALPVSGLEGVTSSGGYVLEGLDTLFVCESPASVECGTSQGYDGCVRGEIQEALAQDTTWQILAAADGASSSSLAFDAQDAEHGPNTRAVIGGSIGGAALLALIGGICVAAFTIHRHRKLTGAATSCDKPSASRGARGDKGEPGSSSCGDVIEGQSLGRHSQAPDVPSSPKYPKDGGHMEIPTFIDLPKSAAQDYDSSLCGSAAVAVVIDKPPETAPAGAVMTASLSSIAAATPSFAGTTLSDGSPARAPTRMAGDSRLGCQTLGDSPRLSTLGSSGLAPGAALGIGAGADSCREASGMVTRLLSEDRESPVIVVAGITIEIMNTIGVGSFGKVFRGSWQGRHVAVKVLQYGAKLCPAVHNEVLLSQTLRHPNVVSALYFGQVLPGGRLGLLSSDPAVPAAGSHSRPHPLGDQLGRRQSQPDTHSTDAMQQQQQQKPGKPRTGSATPSRACPVPAGPTLERGGVAAVVNGTQAAATDGVAVLTTARAAQSTASLHLSMPLPQDLALLLGQRRGKSGQGRARGENPDGCGRSADGGGDNKDGVAGSQYHSLSAPLSRLGDAWLPDATELAELGLVGSEGDMDLSDGDFDDCSGGPSASNDVTVDVLSRWNEQRRRQAHIEAAGGNLIGPALKVTPNGYLLQAGMLHPLLAPQSAPNGVPPPIMSTAPSARAQHDDTALRDSPSFAAAISAADPSQKYRATTDAVGAEAALSNNPPGVTAAAQAAGGSLHLPSHPAAIAAAAASALPLQALWLAAHTQPAEGRSHGFLVLELCEGGSLSTWRGAHWGGPEQRPDLTVLLRLALDIAYGMAYIHSMGVCHGDLKLSNVLLARCSPSTAASHSPDDVLAGWVAKVCDFGLSRVLTGGRTHVSTRPYGTPTHMAPELWTKGHMSQPADVYAFGITLWELATGERPYRGLNAARILHRVLLSGGRPVLPLWLPPSYTRLITSCWAQNAKDRPTFGEIVRHLEAMLAVLAAVTSH